MTEQEDHLSAKADKHAVGTDMIGRDMIGAGMIVPVKAFAQAKHRLSPQLSQSERADLSRSMATHVISVAAPFEVFVVCDDDEVASWAKGLGAEVVICHEVGLNPAVAQGVKHLRHLGFRQAIVAHGDLPLASGFTQFIDEESCVGIAPDRWENGTNVLSVPTECNFEFSYGPGSFYRHIQEANRLGLPEKIHRDPALAFDVDLPCDLKVLETLTF